MSENNNYEATLGEEDFIDEVAINSKVITDKHLKVFMVIYEDFDDYIFTFNKGLKPENDIRGLDSDIVITSNMSWSRRDSLRIEYIKTLNDIFTIRIDSTDYMSDFVFGESLKGQKGFETYISLKDLPEGKHLLKVLRKRINREKDTINVYNDRIPFWYYPN